MTTVLKLIWYLLISLLIVVGAGALAIYIAASFGLVVFIPLAIIGFVVIDLATKRLSKMAI